MGGIINPYQCLSAYSKYDRKLKWSFIIGFIFLVIGIIFLALYFNNKHKLLETNIQDKISLQKQVNLYLIIGSISTGIGVILIIMGFVFNSKNKTYQTQYRKDNDLNKNGKQSIPKETFDKITDSETIESLKKDIKTNVGKNYSYNVQGDDITFNCTLKEKLLITEPGFYDCDKNLDFTKAVISMNDSKN